MAVASFRSLLPDLSHDAGQFAQDVSNALKMLRPDENWAWLILLSVAAACLLAHRFARLLSFIAKYGVP
jgi:hypothetical protein